MDPIVVAVPTAFFSFLISTIAYSLSHRNPRVAWRVGWTVALVLWSVATILVVPNAHPTFCTILSTVGTPLESPDGVTVAVDSSCDRPHWPTILLYAFGYVAIVVLALVTRPRAPRP